MNRRQHRQRTAAWLGLIGGVVGVLAGILQVTVGSRIPTLSGDKASPVALGLLTIALSIIAALSAVLLGDTGITPGRRIAAATGLAVPGALCFTTVGILWYLPGALLLAAVVFVALAGNPAQTRTILTGMWLHILISVLGSFEALMAVSAGPVVSTAVGVVGGIALMTAPWLPSRPIRLVLLLIGTLPFAILTWWSVASPLLAVVALGIGVRTIRRRAGHPPAPVIEPSPVPDRQKVTH